MGRSGTEADQGKDATGVAFGSFAVVLGLWLISATFVFGSIAWVAAALAKGPDDPGGWALIGSSTFVAVLVPTLVAWTGLGGILLTGWADRRIWRPRLRCRDPSRVESGRLTPLWDEVFERAGIHRDAYLLQVSDRPVQNAFAVGDGVITLDQGILGLTDPELKAIIAHELGHHVRRHTASNALGLWFGLPARAMLIVLMSLVLSMLRGAGSIRGCGCSFFYIGLLILLLVPTAALYLLLGGANLLLRLLDRKAELEADSYAAAVGYRSELGRALASLLEIYGDPEPAPALSPERLSSTHPPFADRIAALEAGPDRGPRSGKMDG